MDILLISYIFELKMFQEINDNVLKIVESNKKNFNDYMKQSFLYRNLVSNIINIFASWEQQLYNFAFKFIDNTISNDYKALKTEFEKLDCDIFKDIDELHIVCNTLKHREGSSYSRLKKMNSKYLLENNDYDKLKKISWFNLKILNVSNQTIIDIINILIDFWKKIGRIYNLKHWF